MGHPSILIVGREPSLVATIQSILKSDSDAICLVECLSSVKPFLQEHDFGVAIIHDSAATLQDTSFDVFVDDKDIRIPCIWIASEPTLEGALLAGNKGVFSYLPQPLSETAFEDHVRTAIAQTQLERLILASEERMVKVARQHQRMREASANKALSSSDVVLNSFFEVLFEQVVDAYLDVQQLFFILAQQKPKALQESIRQDPVKRRLVGVIEKGIEVLWGTRNQFKSRQLANLRKDFEGVLEEVGSS